FEVGLVKDLAVPLLDGGDAGGQHQGRTLHLRHCRDTDNRLAGATGQHDHAGTAAHVSPGVEDVGRIALVVADVERQTRTSKAAQVDQQRSTVRVAGKVLGGVADRDKGLLEN